MFDNVQPNQNGYKTIDYLQQNRCKFVWKYCQLLQNSQLQSITQLAPWDTQKTERCRRALSRFQLNLLKLKCQALRDQLVDQDLNLQLSLSFILGQLVAQYLGHLVAHPPESLLVYSEHHLLLYLVPLLEHCHIIGSWSGNFNFIEISLI